MPIDTSIYGNIQQPQIQDPLNALAKVSQIKTLQNQNQLAQLTLADKQRQDGETNKLNSLYQSALGADGKIDRNKLFLGAAQGGLGSKIPGLQKQFSEADKADADVGKTKADTNKTLQETAGHQFELAGQLAASWAQNPTVSKSQIVAGLNAALNSKVISPEIAQAKLDEVSALPDDPRSLNQWATGTLQQVMKAKESMSFIKPDANTVENNQTSRANNAATNATTMRGQNMTDARARDAIQQGKIPAGYRSNGDGTVSPIPGGPADPKAGGIPKLTEDQGKATGWLVQASNAFDNMKAAIVNEPGAAKPGVADAIASVPGLGAIGNHLRSPNRQKFNQASSSLSESLLRAATGAGVNKDEAVQKVQELTPVFGDSPEVIDQKMRAIPLYIDSLKVRAGPGAPSAEKIVNNKAPASGDIHAQADAILRGK